MQNNNNLYIIKSSNQNEDSLIKFGYSSNLKTRLEQYFSHNPFTEVLFTFFKENAIEFEKKFHENNKSAFKNEWYSIYKLEEIIFQINNNIIYKNYKKPLIIKNLKPKVYYQIFEKKCNKCGEIKDSNMFHKNSYNKTGIAKCCKLYCKIINKKYRDLNK